MFIFSEGLGRCDIPSGSCLYQSVVGACEDLFPSHGVPIIRRRPALALQNLRVCSVGSLISDSERTTS